MMRCNVVPRLLVAKFGGSSVATAAQCRKVREIILAHPQRTRIVVSAPGTVAGHDHKITDQLIAFADELEAGRTGDVAWAAIDARFQSMIGDLELHAPLGAVCDHVRAAIHAQPSRNFILSRGEYLLARIMAALLAQSGHAAQFIDAADCIRFTASGALDYDETCNAIRQRTPDNGYSVFPGFYGADSTGTIHTFSRGGSDITGALVACALRAPIYENWTDVSGFYTANPRLVKNARLIHEMTYQAARAIAYAGATVLHQETVRHLVENNIELHVRNTNAPHEPGTRIVAHCAQNHEILGVAGKPGFLIFTVEKMMMNDAVGFGRRLLAVFEDAGIAYDHQVTGIDTLSMIIDQNNLPTTPGRDRATLLQQLTDNLHAAVQPDAITVRTDVAVLTKIGRKNGSTPTMLKYLHALEAEGIETIINSQEIGGQIISVLEERDLAAAVRAVHDAFF